jgi:hypothetical protein
LLVLCAERKSSQLPAGAIAGIAAGGACALLLASTSVWFVLRRRRSNARDDPGYADV